MVRLPSFLLALLAFFATAVHAGEWREHPEWGQAFAEAHVKGTMLVYAEGDGTMHVWNAERARHPYVPASTFKVFNAMVAIDTGAVKDEFETIAWDGKKRPIAEWNRANSLASGMRYSTVWFYQEMARRAGQQRMQAWIDKAGYGNRDISGGIDAFWLGGGLRISAEQQVAFLRRLADGTLPFSQRAQEIARRITVYEAGSDFILHAKTGWGEHVAQDDPNANKAHDLGWDVGWVEHGGKRWFFALNIDIVTPEDGNQRVELARKLLAGMGAFGKP
ncbi:class D beta-lactamase [Luteibacter sp. CQ10]|uniref:class D beta-lactamase n=1 Tax=Luteibacter sp. CQ10 TaxID=2805821 RepID=UPI0034A560D2